MIGVLVFVEAIQSVALSHAVGCGCDVCAAAGGDQRALERLLVVATDERTGTAAS